MNAAEIRILDTLTKSGPMYGLQITGKADVAHSELNYLLSRLEVRGLVESKCNSDGRLYQVTDSGRRMIGEVA